MPLNCMRSVSRSLLRFVADRKGVSAVEFSLILPVMLTMYFGSVELTQGISASRKTTLVAHTVADLVTQTTSVSDAGITDIFNAANAVLAPFDTSKIKVTISSIVIDNNGRATIAWSDTHGGTARPVGQVVTLKPALDQPGTSLIWGEVTYDYTPIYGWVLTGTYHLGDAAMLKPRLSSCVQRPPAVTSC
jgi:Flp pilus assembly protein TadG